MNKDQKITSLEELLDKLCKATNEDPVYLSSLLEVAGRRGFGPLLLLAGIITLAPLIGDIPGVPTIMAVFVFLIAIQLLIGRDHFWLPQWLLKRSVGKEKLVKALDWLYKPAQFIDRWLHPRLRLFVNGVATYAIAVICIIIALAMPVMEFIPFSANAAGGALTVFGLSLITRDGLVSLIGFILTIVTAGLAVNYIL